MAPTDRALFLQHLEQLHRYTDALREGRCRRTTRFTTDLATTLNAFRPLFMAWHAEILFVLHMNGPQRFNAIKRSLAPVSSRVLTDKLQALGDLNVVERNTNKPATYALTSSGDVIARHLHPLLFFLNTRPGVTAN